MAPLTLKRRCDYFPHRQQFVLRMPSAVHEIFIAGVVQDIIEKLKAISSRSDDAGKFARDILHCGSTTITFDDIEYGRHDPDASFSHSEARYPGVVMEVSYSQKKKVLARLAEEYILGSNGDICVVIGLDIEYSGKMATLSIWRSRVVDTEAGEELLAELTVAGLVGCPDLPFCCDY
jgi:hypothetical protein